VLAFFLAARAPDARGDVFALSQGGQVVGEFQNPEQSPRETYLVKTPEGVLLTLARSQVKQVLRPKPEEIEYEKIRSQYPDTAEGQWNLAEWCKEQKLNAQRKVHLQRAIELDPAHEPAHKALGHIKVNGNWTTQREVMAEQGYRWHKDRWRTQQEIDILDEKQQANAAEKEWMQKIGRWLGWLATDRADEARAALLAIRDPVATKGLAAGLRNYQADPDVRVLLAQALAGMGTLQARKALAFGAIEDPVEDVRMACLELLKKKKEPVIVDIFVAKLRDKKSSNATINRAGVALRVMGDRSAVGPLIDALVTVHKFKIGNANPGQMSTTFGSGGGGLSVGSQPKILRQQMQNPDVLDALVALTGQAALGFNVRLWRDWYDAQRNHEAPDVRRDK
jgi:hypothetical protein